MSESAPVDVSVVDFSATAHVLRALRFAVFVNEQGVPAEIEMDERDASCIHVLAMQSDVPIGTGRVDIGQGARIGRVAVLSACRGRGVGTAIMRALHDICISHGVREAWCHAQMGAAGFYEGLGYENEGVPFDEAGIAHVRMHKSLCKHTEDLPDSD